jgi:FixJ family two-component response regulator
VLGYSGEVATCSSQSGEVVYVVDDDISIREAMTEPLQALKLTVISFESAEFSGTSESTLRPA